MTFEVEHPAGSVRLDAFPLLVHAPSVHGPGVRTEDTGVAVAEIAAAFALAPDLAALAARFGTTVGHIRQAVAYAMAGAPDPS